MGSTFKKVATVATGGLIGGGVGSVLSAGKAFGGGGSAGVPGYGPIPQAPTYNSPLIRNEDGQYVLPDPLHPRSGLPAMEDCQLRIDMEANLR